MNNQSHYMSTKIVERGFSLTTNKPRMTENMLLIAKINEYARAAGMSYGQWIAEGQCMLSKIQYPEWVKPQIGGTYEDKPVL